ncbi:Hsp20/alpha crystallin family protein [Thermosulfurimonas sp. F29]|uniref:Hsp20/alpha crystallin family protein n=1 Tax=Thermosulfurimonas sp. F29 TaxID=2867247 RepID=UPI001C82DC69|nr:Hsp20/alpha crystallin family protein [Thermosulfurimonas sp. F29]MBX6423500.1 Hsp20/alpha crystallin family protein [Thermosulfurimonas sp. F29]
MAELTIWRPLQELRREIDRIWDEFFGRVRFPERWEGFEWAPAVDVSETEDSVVVRADVPGLDPEDLEVNISGNLLTIRGEKKQEKEEKKENFYRVERVYGSFVRTVELPAEVEGDKAEATYKNGVLKIVLPKKAEARGKTIKIRVEK